MSTTREFALAALSFAAPAPEQTWIQSPVDEHRHPKTRRKPAQQAGLAPRPPTWSDVLLIPLPPEPAGGAAS